MTTEEKDNNNGKKLSSLSLQQHTNVQNAKRHTDQSEIDSVIWCDSSAEKKE